MIEQIEEKKILSPESSKKAIGKERFFGSQEVEKAFGFKIPSQEIPKIPYSEKELKKAKESGESLILRFGKNLSLREMNNSILVDYHFGKPENNQHPPIYDKGFFLRNEKFMKEKVKTRWVLVSDNFIPYSETKPMIDQLDDLKNHLKKIGGLLKEEERDFENNIKGIRELLKTDKKKAVQKLSKLSIIQNHFLSASELVYDWILKYKNGVDLKDETKYSLAEGSYTTTKSLMSAEIDNEGNFLSMGQSAGDGISWGGVIWPDQSVKELDPYLESGLMYQR